jgi:DNA-binding transcriptional LysR family regulator
MNKEWEDYRVFLAVTRKGGFAPAAPSLGMVTATVKRHIERLEGTMGASLFDRSTQPLTLTAAGLALKSVPESMERADVAFKEAALTEQREARGTVRVLAPELLGEYVLPALFGRLRRSHPEIHIELDLAFGAVPAPGARQGNVADLALMAAPPRSGELTGEHLGHAPYGLFARRDLLDRLGRPTCVEQLDRFPVIGLHSAAKTRLSHALLGLSLANGVTRIRSDTTARQFDAVRSGLGLAICEAPLAARYPELERVLPEVGRDVPLWMITHKSQADVLRVRIVREAIASEIDRYLSAGATEQRARRSPDARAAAAAAASELVVAAMAWASRGPSELAATA